MLNILARLRRTAFYFISFSIISGSLSSTTVDIQPQKDNTLYEDTTGSLSNGSGYYIFTGRSSQTSNSIRRGVISFDVAGSIPAGAYVQDVELTMYMSRTSFGPTNVELHRLNANWGEGTSDAFGEEGGGAPSTENDATWKHTYFDTALWGQLGGNYTVTVSSTAVVDSNGFYSFLSTPQMKADVQGWLDSPNSNFGWIIISDENNAGSSKRFDSKESPVISNRPILKVTYAIPEQLTISATKDNTLYESVSGATSNGAGAHLFVGKTNQITDNLRRGVISFDVAGNIPAGSVIVGAELKLNMSKTISGAQSINLHELLADWGEGASDATGSEGDGAPATINDATWIHAFFKSSMWSTVGGDFDPSPSATTMVEGIGSYTFGSTPQMTAEVQNWLDYPSLNFGWILIGNEDLAASAKRFDTKENAISSNRPQLTVSFIPPPCCILNRGDINNDGSDSNILDLTYLVDRIFRGGPPAPCGVEADVNSDGTASNILDLTYLVDRIFRGGPAPGPC